MERERGADVMGVNLHVGRRRSALTRVVLQGGLKTGRNHGNRRAYDRLGIETSEGGEECEV